MVPLILVKYGNTFLTVFDLGPRILRKDNLHRLHPAFAVSISATTDKTALPSRKRQAAELPGTKLFNTKYLTNRDLLDLKIRDLPFSHHILL